MSTIFSHPVIPLAVGLGVNLGFRSFNRGLPIVSVRLLILGCLFSVLPDLDVIGFEMGVSYWSAYGHRGFTHSILFAALCGLIATYWSHWLGASKKVVFCFLSISMTSHGVLDSMTYGGLGVAFFWPIENAREFQQWRPLPVSPIGIDRFFNNWGVYVMKEEFRLIWAPAAIIVGTMAGVGGLFKRFRRLP